MPALTKAFFIFEDVSVGYDGEINVELVLLAQDTRNQVISRWGRLLPLKERIRPSNFARSSQYQVGPPKGFLARLGAFLTVARSWLARFESIFSDLMSFSVITAFQF
jgi:hypothetical protein